jgi:hypothetical protein
VTEKPEELTEQELEETNGEPLPEREVMSLMQPLPDPVFPIESDPPKGVVPLDDPPPGA